MTKSNTIQQLLNTTIELQQTINEYKELDKSNWKIIESQKELINAYKRADKRSSRLITVLIVSLLVQFFVIVIR